MGPSFSRRHGVSKRKGVGKEGRNVRGTGDRQVGEKVVRERGRKGKGWRKRRGGKERREWCVRQVWETELTSQLSASKGHSPAKPVCGRKRVSPIKVVELRCQCVG